MNRWDGIEEFAAVAQFKSFKLAAESLGLSTSHVSRAIQRLENRIDSALFYRTTRQVSLTDTGRSLLDHCVQLIRDRDEALALAVGDREPTGGLRITCAVALGERFVAPIVRNYMLEYPKLSIHLELSNRVHDVIAEGFDLAIRTGDLSDSRLMRTLITRRHFRTVAAPAYLDANGAPKDLEQLGGHACVVGTSNTWHFHINGERVSFEASGRWKCNSGDATVDAAIAGMGICQMPEFYVRTAMERGELISVLDDIQDEPEPIWAVYPQRRHLMPKVNLLVERLKAELGPAIRGETSV